MVLKKIHKRANDILRESNLKLIKRKALWINGEYVFLFIRRFYWESRLLL